MRRTVHFFTTAGATAVLLSSAIASAQLQEAKVRVIEAPAEDPPARDIMKQAAPAAVAKQALRIEPAKKAMRGEIHKKAVQIEVMDIVAPLGIRNLLKAVVPNPRAVNRPAFGVMPPPPVMPEPVFEKTQKDEMTENMVRQLRPLLRAELHLIRTVCKPSKKAQERIAAEGERVLKATSGDLALWQLKAQQGVAGIMPNPTAAIQKSLTASIEKWLSTDQAGRYRAEIEVRNKEEKEIAAKNLVARFDGFLNLSSEQRDKIAASLVKTNEPMTQSLDVFMYNNNEYVPAVQDRAVVEFLDARQKQLWRNAQKVHMGGSSFGINGVSLTEGDFAEEDAPVSTVEAVLKKSGRGFGGLVNFLNRLPQPPMNIMPAPVAPVRIAPGIRVRAKPAEPPVAPDRPAPK